MHHTFHIRFGVAHLAKEICEFLKISNALEAGRRLLLAESTVEIAAACNVAGVASELTAVVDVIDDGFEPDLGNGSFPGHVTGKHSGYCILSSEMPPTRSKCLAKRSIKVNSRLPNSLAGTGKAYMQENRPRRLCPTSSALSISNPTAPRYTSNWGRHI